MSNKTFIALELYTAVQDCDIYIYIMKFHIHVNSVHTWRLIEVKLEADSNDMMTSQGRICVQCVTNDIEPNMTYLHTVNTH